MNISKNQWIIVPLGLHLLSSSNSYKCRNLMWEEWVFLMERTSLESFNGTSVCEAKAKGPGLAGVTGSLILEKLLLLPMHPPSPFTPPPS